MDEKGVMHLGKGLGRKLRRFWHEHGAVLTFYVLLIGILVMVAVLMYAMTSPDWRLKEPLD